MRMSEDIVGLTPTCALNFTSYKATERMVHRLEVRFLGSNPVSTTYDFKQIS